ncbi:Glycosyl hydrolase family 65, N-terminal domain-containing protein [Bifidobacterium sp. DSM 109958]|uniref:Glycosyl hydrolase family 65, N-terminal domain-containing protein n=1 Tax=Bifidobacterium moraviense TaxID=2675323 RepID=A0A7Y0F1J1_9BIFI|nr:glycoside hydrolase family 95 protein [Bifidobacterium sp. DSM 109958]NMN00329.1 Glycosyl hydrolase family 65, N-terminal domain-containing protein [Bifidobacterium sp. DSM 109958]
MTHRLSFSAPARDWTEALPIGNGFMGAMVFGGTRRERLQVNEDSVWSGGPRDRLNPDAHRAYEQVRALLRQGDVAAAQELAAMGMFSPVPDARHYETLGDVFVNVVPAGGDGTENVHVANYRRTLDLDAAMHRVTFDDVDGTHERRCFASYPDMTMVHVIDEPSPANIRVTVERRSHEKKTNVIWHCDGIDRPDDATVRLYGTNGSHDGITYVLAVRVVGADDGCRVRAMGRTIAVDGTRRAVVLVTARTTFRSEDPMRWCLDTLDAAEAAGVEELERRHRKDMEDFARRDRATLRLGSPDPALDAMDTPDRLARLRKGKSDPGLIELHCALARYLLIASSREGSLPANLQGIWCEDFDSPWGAKYTININTEMNYWFAEAMGFGDLHMPLLEHIRRMRPHGERVAREMYGLRGFVCHHNTDIWGDCAPVDAYMPATLWPMGAAWLCLHLVDHYRYSRDAAFARDCLPTVASAVRFLVDVMERDDEGHWALPVSLSPENTYRTPDGGSGNLCAGTAMDVQIARELFRGYLELVDAVGADGLGNDDNGSTDDTGLAALVRDRIDALTPIRIGSTGRLLEWDREYAETEPGHRHFSPLFAVYPAAQIRPDSTPKLADAALALLRHRIEHGSGGEGWSRAWSAMLFARLGRAEEAWEGVVRLLTDSAFDNLFNADKLGRPGTPFQIDGNFGGLAAVLELLVHDYGDEVALLPALPEALEDGALTGLRLRAGCALDMTWSHGALVSCAVTGLRDGEVTLIMPGGGHVPVRFGAGRRIGVVS